jgi:hypothetical protein
MPGHPETIKYLKEYNVPLQAINLAKILGTKIQALLLHKERL